MLLLALALACADKAPADSTPDSQPPTGPGTLLLSFRMEEDLIPSMEEPPVGTFRGSIFAEADAEPTGPIEGAVALLDIAVAIDLSLGPAVDVFTTELLDPQIVWVLGCLDSDDNDCDVKDPITVPTENKAQILPETTTSFEVFMGMLRP